MPKFSLGPTIYLITVNRDWCKLGLRKQWQVISRRALII